ncbi:hypothetical protein DYB36_009138 [Aphanomyces astaci]|uniref:Uncharacterized protein n=1 Tax=Aphanomyces astaci TaxID=112090 RepID=A0A397AI83_APHAT|nr:hypothetical protein DYB36_009138 [Aphanomyces astaci]
MHCCLRRLQGWFEHLSPAVRRSSAFRDAGMTVDSLVSIVRSFGFAIAGDLAGAEPGVRLADSLSEALGVRTNGSAGSAARRNKFVMGETIRKAGLRAVKQCRAMTWADAERFISSRLLVNVVNYDHRTLKVTPGLREIKAMQSYVESRVESTVAVVVTPTIDAFTPPGCILLVHADSRVRERHGLYEFAMTERTEMYGPASNDVGLVVHPLADGDAVVA